MNNKILIVPLLVLFSCSARASLVWHPVAAGQTKQSSSGLHAGHGRHGGNKFFTLHDSVGGNVDPEVELWLPTQVRRPLTVNAAGQVPVSGTGLDSYHMLFAKKASVTNEEVAMRYLYLQGKPAGVSPSELVNAHKATLDITPAPLTREHQRYLGKKPARFIVTYKARPLTFHPVILTTTNGSELGGITDESGYIRFHLPDDFNDVEAGRRNNPPADFVVSTSFQTDGRHYHTTVSAPYYVSPSHWQSFEGGLIAMFAGMVTGLAVLQRSRKSGNAAMKGVA